MRNLHQIEPEAPYRAEPHGTVFADGHTAILNIGPRIEMQVPRPALTVDDVRRLYERIRTAPLWTTERYQYMTTGNDVTVTE